MLVFLLVCFFFQTLQGAPLTPDASQSLSARDSPAAPDQQYRTTFDILKSCLLTIFACVWTSAHPNLNGPRDSGCTCFKRKVVTMLCALIAPEFVLLWALRQRSGAKEIAEQYNSKFATSSAHRYLSFMELLAIKSDQDEKKNKSLRENPVDWFSHCRKILDWFHPLPKETTRRGAGQEWTTTHGFFIQMGGFILYSDSYPVEVLTYKRLALLLEKKAIDAPTVTERELQDRSKGDWLSKGIIVLQTTWFIVQCAARASRRLPLNELEVLTLAFAVMNGAIYAAWWDKPQSVDTAICVPLKPVYSEKSTSVDSQGTMLPSVARAREASAGQHEPVDHPSAIKSMVEDTVPPSVVGNQEASTQQPPHPDHDDGNVFPLPGFRSHSRMSDSEPLIPPQKKDQQVEHASFKWLRSNVRDDRENYSSSLVRLLRLPYMLVVLMFRVLTKFGVDYNSFDRSYLRVPMFYGESSDVPGLMILLPAVLFGAVHLLAWSSEFASTRDLVLWRVSAVIVTVTPVIAALANLLHNVPDEKQSGLSWICGIITSLLLTIFHICWGLTHILAMISLILYMPARVTLIFVAFNSFRNTPPGVLIDVPWTSYLPHL